MIQDPRGPALDESSRAALDAQALQYDLVDTADEAPLRRWYEAEARAFLDPAGLDAAFAEIREDLRGRRLTAVHDPSVDDAGTPVATIESWRMGLALPGGSSIDAWAISAVSVAPTHRRRGIARAMLEGELRAAVAAGAAVAVLTATEATLYERYGFGPAAQIAELAISARRARWTGGSPEGRIQLVGRDRMLESVAGLEDRARRRAPGGVGVSGLLLTRLLGRPSDEGFRALRFARYDDADGTPQGYLSYTTTESHEDTAESTAHVVRLAAATDDAYAALWRFVLELDLVTTVTARLRSVDEPLRWLVADQRAIRTTQLRDHLWVRVLDPVAALSARGYAGPARIVLDVADPLGHAAGVFLLAVDASGAAAVERLDGPAPDDVLRIALDVAPLGALLLGGVPVDTLARAGRLGAISPADAAALDRVLRSPVVPWCGVWF